MVNGKYGEKIIHVFDNKFIKMNSQVVSYK